MNSPTELPVYGTTIHLTQNIPPWIYGMFFNIQGSLMKGSGNTVLTWDETERAIILYHRPSAEEKAKFQFWDGVDEAWLIIRGDES